MARPAGDIKHRIVRAAREQFLALGVEGAPLRAIARQAGTSIGMVYYYFPSKDDLFLEVVEEVYVGLLGDLERALERDAPVQTRIERLYTRIGSMTPLEAETIQLIAREAFVSSERFEKLIERFQRGHLPLIFATLADGVDDGTLSSELPPGLLFVSTLALGSVPQLIRRVAGGRLPFGGILEGQEYSRALVSVLLSGIGARTERPTPVSRKKARRESHGKR